MRVWPISDTYIQNLDAHDAWPRAAYCMTTQSGARAACALPHISAAGCATCSFSLFLSFSLSLFLSFSLPLPFTLSLLVYLFLCLSLISVFFLFFFLSGSLFFSFFPFFFLLYFLFFCFFSPFDVYRFFLFLSFSVFFFLSPALLNNAWTFLLKTGCRQSAAVRDAKHGRGLLCPPLRFWPFTTVWKKAESAGHCCRARDVGWPQR